MQLNLSLYDLTLKILNDFQKQIGWTELAAQMPFHSIY